MIGKSFTIISLLILLSSFHNLLGQRIYYDSLWKETIESNADYYRIIDTISSTDFLVKDHYKEGTIQMVGHFTSVKKDKREGEFIWYHKNGMPSAKRIYKNGKLNGKIDMWYENGQQRVRGFYLQNKQDGNWTWWYANGNVKTEIQYVDNKFAGFWTTYYENRMLKTKYGYTKGKFNGDAMIWDSLGVLLCAIKLDSKLNTGSFKIYYSNGKPRAIGQIRNNRPVDEWLFYYEDGILSMKGTCENGRKVGTWSYYYENGETEKTLIYTKKDRQKFEINLNEMTKQFSGK